MVDQLLGGLFGGQDDEDDDRRRNRGRDFVNRYETGQPHEGYTDQEAVHNYRQVASQLSPQQYEEAAAETFMRMSPDERKQLRREMRQRSKGRMNFDDNNDDPREMARTTARYQQEDTSGGGLAGLFGGGNDNQNRPRGEKDDGGSLLDNPLAKVALGGIAAMAVKKMTENR